MLDFLDLRSVDRYKGYSNLVLRVGIAAVFLYFGVNEILSPGFGLNYLSPWATSMLQSIGIPLETLILLLGIGHVVGAAALLVGWKTRFFALITVFILAAIILNLGYNELSVRDFAIMTGAMLLFLQGGGKYSLDGGK